MRHYTTSGFWAMYEALPPKIRDLADQSFRHLEDNPRHPSLHFKKAGVYWSARVGQQYRALATEVDDGLLWFWIGNHADYDRLLRR